MKPTAPLFSSPSGSPQEPTPQSSRILLWLVALGSFMQMLDATSVNTALPRIAQNFNVDPIHTHWVLVAFILTCALVLPATGWIADRFGTRKVYAFGVMLFILGAVVCACAPHLMVLIAGRIIQGAAQALLVPVGRLAVLRTFSKENFLRVMNFVMIPGLIGQVIGPTLGGLLVQYLSWKWVFLVNVPIGIACAFFTLAAMPDTRAPNVQRFDLTGYIFLAIAMLTLSLGLDGLTGVGLPYTVILFLLVVGILACMSYWRHSQRTVAPLFAAALFEVRSFKIGIIGNIFARLGSGSIPFMLPLFMQVGLGYSPAKAGMMLLPMAIAAIFAKQVSTWLIQRYGYRLILITNTIALGCVIVSFSLMTDDLPLWVRLVMITGFGAANSIQFSAMNSATLKDLGKNTASSGNSLLSMTQLISMSLGISVASIMLSLFQQYFSVQGNGAHVLSAFHWSFFFIGLIMVVAAWIFSALAVDRPIRKDASTALNRD